MKFFAALGLAALALLVTITMIDILPPRPVSGSGSGFSAAKAAETVRTTLSVSRPVGSPEHDRVREELLKRLRDLGLEPRVQEAVGRSQLTPTRLIPSVGL